MWIRCKTQIINLDNIVLISYRNKRIRLYTTMGHMWEFDEEHEVYENMKLYFEEKHEAHTL